MCFYFCVIGHCSVACANILVYMPIIVNFVTCTSDYFCVSGLIHLFLLQYFLLPADSDVCFPATPFHPRGHQNHKQQCCTLKCNQHVRFPVEHLLQSCPVYEPLRKGIWPDHTPVARKLYRSLRDLQCSATFIEETGVSIFFFFCV